MLHFLGSKVRYCRFSHFVKAGKIRTALFKTLNVMCLLFKSKSSKKSDSSRVGPQSLSSMGRTRSDQTEDVQWTLSTGLHCVPGTKKLSILALFVLTFPRLPRVWPWVVWQDQVCGTPGQRSMRSRVRASFRSSLQLCPLLKNSRSYSRTLYHLC